MAIIAVAVVFLISGAVYAKEQGKYYQHNDRHKEKIFKELDLTPQQEKRLEENRKAQREEMVKLHTAIKEKQSKLQQTLKNPTVTREAVEPLINEIKSLQARLIDHRVNGIFAVREILTPEQFTKFQEMVQKQQKDRKGRFQSWREKKKKGQ